MTSPTTAPTITDYEEPFAGSLTPAELRGAYDLNSAPLPTNTQTVALVDAFDDPKAEADLRVYDEKLALPPCTEADGCFRKVNQEGASSPLPSSNTEGKEPEAGWALETSTDIEIAHGVCQSCRILLVEADEAQFPDLEAAEDTAVRLGASEISNSWGGPECAKGTRGVECEEENLAFDHPGVVIAAAAGDDGYLDWATKEANERGYADYPASLPDVVAIGGTRLLQSDGTWESETVWNDGGQTKKGEIDGSGAGGSGCSRSFPAPSWQLSLANWESVGCGAHRAVADVSADADPYTGVAVYDSTPIDEEGEEIEGWDVLGGTSVASPIVTSIFGLVGGAHGVAYPARTLYENAVKAPGSLHDVTVGSNGKCTRQFGATTGASGCTLDEEAVNCSSQAICLASTGYDGPSGVGTPDGLAAFEAGVREEGKRNPEEQGRTEEEGRKEKSEQEERERSGFGGGSTGPGTGTGGPPSAPTPIAAPPTAVAAPTVTSTATSPSPSATTTLMPILSALALTRTATAALRHSRPKAVQLAFVFTLNLAARVRVTLAKQVDVHGHLRWTTLPYTLSIPAAKGRDTAHLTAGASLASGRYRLALTPVHGKARALTFQIRPREVLRKD